VTRPARARHGLVWRLYAVGVVQFLLVALSALLIGYVMSRMARWDTQTLIARLKPLSNDPAALAREVKELGTREHLLISIYDADGHLLLSNVEPALRAPLFGGRLHPPPPNDDRPPPDDDRPPPDDDRPPPDDDRPPLAHARPAPDDPEHLLEFGPRGPPVPPGFSDLPHLGGPAFHGGHPPPFDNFARFEVNGRDALLVARFEHPKPSPLPPILTLFAGLAVLGVGALLTARWIARPLSQLSRMAVSLGKGDLRARSELARNDEVGEVARAFDEMAERIQKLLQAEKELLANVAHELRTPLARIRVALEIAGEGDAETARHSLAEIAVDLSELEALIDDVLTAARFELSEDITQRSSFSLHLQPIAAQTIGERAAERFRSRHPARPFETYFAPDSGMVEADPVLLRRVLDNLLENAHKYSPDPDAKITLSVFAQGDRACFSVSDHGLGIPAEDLPRVFTAFFRGERSRSRGTGGVGLGLTLAQRIVEAHRGSIEASSTVGQGSVFRAFLPRQRGAESAPESGAEPRPA
jgi:signal transduction histidine kinase